MYAVTGATGQTGRQVINALLERGERVRAILRSPEKAKALKDQGIEIAVADIENPNEVIGALDNVRGVYLMRPPEPRSAGKAVAESYREAIRKTDVGRIIVLSSIGAHQPTGTGVIATLYDLEEQLNKAERTLTFLRASFFMENWLNVMGAVQANGVLPSFLPADFRMPMVAVVDIGKAAARLLTDDGESQSVIELEGPRLYTANEVAAALGDRLGKEVQVVEIPADERQAVLEDAGIPGPLALELAQMYAGIVDGTVVHETGQPVLQGDTTLKKWVADNV
jgi:uncharacterized protein YbjT (DUF2867 family)